MIRNWAEDIRSKTKNMSRQAKAEYILNYYWYHMLLGVLLTGLLILGVYHVTWGNKKTAFSLVIVNQDINFERDAAIQEAFARFSGLPVKQVQADSDYMISYGDVQFKGVNESSYEKFFFGWSAGVMDAVVMPESFYDYCKRQNGTFLPLTQLLETSSDISLDRAEFFANLQQSDHSDGDIFLNEDGECFGIYIEKTDLSSFFMHNAQDPYVLVFPSAMKHRQSAGKFLIYALMGASRTEQSDQEGW